MLLKITSQSEWKLNWYWYIWYISDICNLTTKTYIVQKEVDFFLLFWEFFTVHSSFFSSTKSIFHIFYYITLFDHHVCSMILRVFLPYIYRSPTYFFFHLLSMWDKVYFSHILLYTTIWWPCLFTILKTYAYLLSVPIWYRNYGLIITLSYSNRLNFVRVFIGHIKLRICIFFLLWKIQMHTGKWISTGSINLTQWMRLTNLSL